MSVLKSVPVVSQVISLAQVIGGDVEGAKATQNTFSKRCPGVSQIRSAVQAASGDVEGARATQDEFTRTCPVVAQVRSAVEVVRGDIEGARATQKKFFRAAVFERRESAATTPMREGPVLVGVQLESGSTMIKCDSSQTVGDVTRKVLQKIKSKRVGEAVLDASQYELAQNNKALSVYTKLGQLPAKDSSAPLQLALRKSPRKQRNRRKSRRRSGTLNELFGGFGFTRGGGGQGAGKHHQVMKTSKFGTDRDYGFEADSITPAKAAWRERYAVSLAKQRKEWDESIKLPLPAATLRRKHGRLLRMGVPRRLRAEVWAVLAGLDLSKHKKPSDFPKLVARFENECHATGTKEAKEIAYIIKDVRRTFQNHPHFQDQHGLDALTRVLGAFSLARPQIGYCQSINFVAGLLLLLFDIEAEEVVFEILCSLTDSMPAYWEPAMSGVHLDMDVLRELVARREPKLAEHLEKLGADIRVACVEWFMCLFVTTVPIETAVRIWDVLLSEGDATLHSVALALLGLHADELLRLESAGEVFQMLGGLGSNMWDCDKLLQAAFERPVSSDSVAKLRKQCARRESKEKRKSQSADKRKSLQAEKRNRKSQSEKRKSLQGERRGRKSLLSSMKKG